MELSVFSKALELLVSGATVLVITSEKTELAVLLSPPRHSCQVSTSGQLIVHPLGQKPGYNFIIISE